MKTDIGNAANVIIKGASTLSFKMSLLFNFLVNGIKSVNRFPRFCSKDRFYSFFFILLSLHYTIQQMSSISIMIILVKDEKS